MELLAEPFVHLKCCFCLFFLFCFVLFVCLFFCTEVPMDDIKKKCGSSLEVLCTGCSSNRPSTCARCPGGGGGPEGWPLVEVARGKHHLTLGKILMS